MESDIQFAKTMGGYRPKILIVDDEPRILRSLDAALRSSFDICLADNAIQAQKILRGSEKIDVIVSDEKMPKCTGLTFLKWAKENVPQSVRILLTSSELANLQDPIKEAGVYRCLPKPWNMQTLRKTLDHAVLKSQALATHELPSAKPRQCAMAILDLYKTYMDSYQILGENLDGILGTYLFYTPGQLISAMAQSFSIGVIVIDLSIGEKEAATLIKELNEKHSSVSIIVAAEAGPLKEFVQMFEKPRPFLYYTRPMTMKQIQPVVSQALQQYISAAA